LLAQRIVKATEEKPGHEQDKITRWYASLLWVRGPRPVASAIIPVGTPKIEKCAQSFDALRRNGRSTERAEVILNRMVLQTIGFQSQLL